MMREEIEKRKKLYRKVLQKDPVLFQISEELFNENNEDTTQAVSTAYVLAPIMNRYVMWVLLDALQQGKKRLYFLARDGYSMYWTAKTLCETAGIPIECRYLHCSRYAWRSAEFVLLGKESLSYVCLGGIEVSFAKLMRRAGLSDSEGRQIGQLLGFTEDYDKSMTYNEVKVMEPILAERQEFMEMMLSHSKEKYPAVCNYLKQEGLLDEVPFAIVDSGWVGSMQKCLQNILDSMGFQDKVEGYYFGMYEYPKDVDRALYHTYYFAPYDELRRKVYFSNSLFECIFSSPEGMTVGYEDAGTICRPKMENTENPNRDRIMKSTAFLQEYAKRFAKKFPEEIMTQADTFRDVAAQLLYYFMGKPTLAEAQEYGTYVFCDDVIGEEAQTVASPLTAQEIRDNRVLRKGIRVLLKRGEYVRESAWPEGSTVLAEKVSRGELVHCAIYKYVLYLRKRMK